MFFCGHILCLHALIDCCLECVLESVCKCLEVLFESVCICSVVKEDRSALFLPTKGIVFTSVNIIAWWSDMPGRISIQFSPTVNIR